MTKAATRGRLAVFLTMVLTVSGLLVAPNEAGARTEAAIQGDRTLEVAPTGDPEIGECVTATNWEHVLAGRAYTWLGLWVLTGTGGVYLGLLWDTRSLMRVGPDQWSPNSGCAPG